MRGCPGTPTAQQIGITDYRQDPGVGGVWGIVRAHTFKWETGLSVSREVTLAINNERLIVLIAASRVPVGKAWSILSLSLHLTKEVFFFFFLIVLIKHHRSHTHIQKAIYFSLWNTGLCHRGSAWVWISSLDVEIMPVLRTHVVQKSVLWRLVLRCVHQRGLVLRVRNAATVLIPDSELVFKLEQIACHLFQGKSAS